MKIQNNKVVAVSYALEVEGRIADQSAPGAPLEYIHGSGMLLPKFEAALETKEPGDAFDFILSPEDGCGIVGSYREVNSILFRAPYAPPKNRWKINVSSGIFLFLSHVCRTFGFCGKIVQVFSDL